MAAARAAGHVVAHLPTRRAKVRGRARLANPPSAAVHGATTHCSPLASMEARRFASSSSRKPSRAIASCSLGCGSSGGSACGADALVPVGEHGLIPSVSSDDCARRAPTPRTASGEEEGAGGGGSNKLALTGVVGGHENGGRDAGRAACARTWLPVVTRPGSAVDGASDCGP